MSVTKSLRISEDDDAFLKRLREYLNEPTESAVLKRIFQTGLQRELVEIALKIYQESPVDVSLSTIARDFNLPPVHLYTVCLERGVKVLDADAEDFREDMRSAVEYFGDAEHDS